MMSLDLTRRSSSEVRELAILTDAEIAALDPSPAVAPSPHLDRSANPAADIATARDGLVARSLAGDDGSPTDPDLAELLRSRRDASAWFIAQQQVLTDSQSVVVHLQPADRCVVEEVDSDGIHRFASGESRDVLIDLAHWASGDARTAELADEAATRASIVDLSVEEFEQQATERLGWAERVTVIALVRPGDAAASRRRVSVYSSPIDLAVAMGTGDGSVRLCRVDTDRLAAIVLSMLAETRDS